VPLHQAAKLVAALLRVAGVTAGLGKVMAAGFMTQITVRLTAKNRDQLRYPTLGNRVWATLLSLLSLTDPRHCIALQTKLVDHP